MYTDCLSHQDIWTSDMASCFHQSLLTISQLFSAISWVIQQWLLKLGQMWGLPPPTCPSTSFLCRVPKSRNRGMHPGHPTFQDFLVCYRMISQGDQRKRHFQARHSWLSRFLFKTHFCSTCFTLLWIPVHIPEIAVFHRMPSSEGCSQTHWVLVSSD